MRNFDFSPLFRSTIGFDRMNRLLESAFSADESAQSYPPYNIEKTGEGAYRITMAVAGFSEQDLDINVQENTLTIKGKAKAEPEGSQYLYRGIAGRAFERRFQLVDYVKVKGASLVNGLLHVELVREIPEQMKPRTIKIDTNAPRQVEQVEQQKAA